MSKRFKTWSVEEAAQLPAQNGEVVRFLPEEDPTLEEQVEAVLGLWGKEVEKMEHIPESALQEAEMLLVRLFEPPSGVGHLTSKVLNASQYLTMHFGEGPWKCVVYLDALGLIVEYCGTSTVYSPTPKKKKKKEEKRLRRNAEAVRVVAHFCGADTLLLYAENQLRQFLSRVFEVDDDDGEYDVE